MLPHKSRTLRLQAIAPEKAINEPPLNRPTRCLTRAIGGAKGKLWGVGYVADKRKAL
jgi:hypothetical protein